MSEPDAAPGFSLEQQRAIAIANGRARAAAAAASPGGTPDKALDDVAHAAGAGTIARASLAPDPQVQIKRYAEAFKQPESDFGIVGDHIIRKVPETGQYARVEPSVSGGSGPLDTAERAMRWVAGGAGPAIPAVASGAAATAAAILAGPETLGAGSLPAAMTASGVGASAGEIARQKLDAALAPKGEEAPMDWKNVGWQGAAGVAAPVIGAVGGKIADRIAPVLANAAADELPAGATAARAALTEGTAPVSSAASFGLSPRVADALKQHIAGKEAELAQLREDAQSMGVDLSLGQMTGSTAVQQSERQLARTPEAADLVANLRRTQNEEQIPGAVRSVLDEVSPPVGREAAISSFRGGADAVVDAAEQARAEAAGPLYESAFKANKSVQSPLIDKILNTPEGKDALNYAVTRMQNRMARVAVPDPELTEQMADLVARGEMKAVPGGVAPGLKLQTLDLVKQGLWDAEDALRKRVLSGTARQGEVNDIAGLRAAFTNELDRLDATAAAGPNSTKAAGGLYKQARVAFGDPSDAIDAMKQGGIGFIQKMTGPDRQNIVNRVFSGGNLLPEEIGRMREQFAAAGRLPDWNAGIRSFVEDKLSAALNPTQNGELSNVGGKMFRGLFANDSTQADVMRAALGGDAADVTMGRWNKLGNVLRAAAHQLPEGSPTATDTNAPGLVARGIQGAKYILHPASMGPDLLEGLEKMQNPENTKRLATYLLTPEGDKLLKALYPTTPGTPKANSILTNMLTQAGIVATEGATARAAQ